MKDSAAGGGVLIGSGARTWLAWKGTASSRAPRPEPRLRAQSGPGVVVNVVIDRVRDASPLGRRAHVVAGHLREARAAAPPEPLVPPLVITPEALEADVHSVDASDRSA